MLLAYRKQAVANKNKFGVPGVRDPEAECSSYAPRKPLPGDFVDCQTDGHYLCKKCAHKDSSNSPVG